VREDKTTTTCEDSSSDRDPRVLEGPIFRTLLAYAVPSLIGLIAISTASLVDGVFVGQFVSSRALAAVSLLVPYFTLLFGTALMLAVGGTIRAGRRLGEGDAASASAVFSRTLALTLALCVGAALLSTVFEEALFRVLGAPPSLLPEMREYFRVITWVLVVQLAGLVVYYFVRLDGRPVLATTALVLGAAANLALDALFVAHFRWGLEGAAFSTLFAQVLQLGVLLSHFAARRGQLRFHLVPGGWTDVPRTASGGASEFVNEVSAGALMLILNFLMLKRAGVDGVAAFSVVNYAIFASLMIFYGVADALHVLFSQNLGARNAARIQRFLESAVLCVLGLSMVFCAGVFGLAERWSAIFVPSSSPEVLERAASFLRLVSPLFLVNGLNVVLTVYLASMHRPLPAGLLALSRSLLLPASLMLLLTWCWPAAPFLLALPLAEWATLAVAIWFTRRFPPALCVGLHAPSARGAS
jgi:Na+-driven multidrug efflux pump